MASQNSINKKRIPRLYVGDGLKSHVVIILSTEQSHYLSTVLRKKPGDSVLLFNGKDGEWSAILKQETKKMYSAVLTAPIREQSQEEDVWLGFSPIKKHRQDLLIEKATELGVSRLVPLEMAYTNLGSFNQEKMFKQSMEAAEQSERLSVPNVEGFSTLTEWLRNWPKGRLLYVALERNETNKRLGGILEKKEAAFLVGPEGGFSEPEKELLSRYAFVRFFSLGLTILRSETAAILCMGLYQELKRHD